MLSLSKLCILSLLLSDILSINDADQALRQYYYHYYCCCYSVAILFNVFYGGNDLCSSFHTQRNTISFLICSFSEFVLRHFQKFLFQDVLLSHKTAPLHLMVCTPAGNAKCRGTLALFSQKKLKVEALVCFLGLLLLKASE